MKPSGYLVFSFVSFLLFCLTFLSSSAQSPSISYGSAKVLQRAVAVSASISPTNGGGAIPAHTYRTVSLLAGSSAGDVDGSGAAAKLNKPHAVTIDAAGNLYIADTYNHKIKKVTPGGTVTTLAGDGYEFLYFGRLRNGDGTAASFNYPTDIAIHPDGSCLYVADMENEVIRKISLTSPFTVTTFAGSGTAGFLDHATTGTSARFNKPVGLHYDNSGSTHYLYVADRNNHRIRRITLSSTSGATATAGEVSTLAGSGTAGATDGAAATARFYNPVQVVVTSDGSTVYVADYGNNKIRKIASGTVSTLAGSGTAGSTDGTGTAATFNGPQGIEIDGAGNLMIGDFSGHRIRRITPAGIVTTIAGTGTAGTTEGVGTSAAFDNPFGMVFDADDALLYICDYGNNRIRKMQMGGYVLGTTLPAGLSMAGTTGVISGTPTTLTASASYTITGYNYYGSSETTLTLTVADLPVVTTTSPLSVTLNSASSGGNISSDGGDAVTARGVVWSTSASPTVSLSTKTTDGTGTGSFSSNITGLISGTTYYVRAYATNGAGTAYGTQSSFTTLETAPSMSYPSSTHTFPLNTAITPLVLTNTGGTPAALQTSRFAGQTFGFADGTGTSAKFGSSEGMAFDRDGNIILADQSNHSIRKITPAGVVTTIAGSGTSGYVDGPSVSAKFNTPRSVAVDADGNIYVTEEWNHRIRKIDLSGNVTTFAGSGYGYADGTGSAAKFNRPVGITYAPDGKLYVADMGNDRIRIVTLAGVVSTLAGGAAGFSDGTGIAAKFYGPYSITSDGLGNLYVTEVFNHAVRKVVIASGVVTSIAGSGAKGSTDGTGAGASFYYPEGVYVSAGGYILVTDASNHIVRKVTTDGVVTTLLGSVSSGSQEGSGTSARFFVPCGILEDAQGTIYVSERGNRIIRKVSRYRISPALPTGLSIDMFTGIISGTPTVAMAPRNYTIYASNSGGTSNVTLTLAVSGPPTVTTESTSGVSGTSAVINGTVNPNGGNTSSIVFKYSTVQADVDAGNGTSIVTPFSASGFTNTSVNASPTGLTPSTTYYYKLYATTADGTSRGETKSFTTAAAAPSISYWTSTLSLRAGTAISPLTLINTGGNPELMQVTTIAGNATQGNSDGAAATATFDSPLGIAVDTDGNIYVANTNRHRIRKITPAGAVSTIAGASSSGTSDGVGAAARFFSPQGLALDGLGNLYVADQWNHRIRKIVLGTGEVTTIAGSTEGFKDDVGTVAQFKYPMGIVVGGDGNLYVAESNHLIRKIDLTTMSVTTLAGSSSGFADGIGSYAKFNSPYGLSRNGTGHLIIGSGYNNRVRKVQLTDGFVYTIAGGASASATDGPVSDARFNFPAGVANDVSGNIYVADMNNHMIRKISWSGNDVMTLAGNASGFSDGAGTTARFNSPSGIALDAQGNLWVADAGNHSIRRLSLYSISPALPAGLSFNPATGQITGTPTANSSTTQYTVTAANAGGTSSATLTIEVSSSLTTSDVSAIRSTSATAGGTVDATAYAGATQKGVCWNTTGAPTISDNKTENGSGTGTFTSSLTGLTANTTYYLRSYVTVGGVTSYGSEKTFKTNRSMSLSPMTKSYGDAAFALTPPTSNSTGTWSYASGTTSVATISGSTVTIAGAGSSVITATQAAAGAYAATSVTFTLTVNKAIPTITLNIPNTTTLAAATNMPITATASNGEPVTITIGSGTATGTLSGSPGSYTLGSVSSTGNLVFNATTAETANHAAGSKSVTMDVTKNNQTITFNALPAVSYTAGMTQTLSATSTSGQAVSFAVLSGPGTLTGTTLSIIGTGIISIRASQAGTGSFNAAPDIDRTLIVNPSAPIIASFTPTSATEGDVVTITGQYFEDVLEVSFGGTLASFFTVVDANTITAVVGTGHTGSVTVATIAGGDVKAGFRYKAMWTGGTNAFNSTGNWSGGRVPQTDDDIIFSPTAASDLELDGHKTVGHVNFNGSGRSLKLGAHNLTIKGNLTMPGNITGTGRVIMNGASAQTITGGGDIPDLEINNSTGVTIDGSGDELTVSGTLTSTSGTLTTSGKLRLKSNSSGTARVGVVSGSITGNVIAERYVKRNENSEGTGRAWRLVSVPVTGTGTLRDFFMNGRNGQDLTVTTNRDAETENSGTPIVGHNYADAASATAAGFDWIGVANSVSSLRYYTGDAAGGSFASENVPTMTTDYANAAQGYMVFARGDRKLDFPSATSSGATTFRSAGSLKTGTQTVSVAPASTSKFTLVGNPYMSVLDLDAFYTTNSAVINPSFWIWESNMAGTNNQGGYVNVYKSGTQWVTNTGSYIDPQLIESGIAFFVEPVSSLSTATNINITEAHKSAASSAGLSPFATDQPDDHGRMYVRLERADAKGQRQLIDGVMADFHASFKTALGDPSDREKLRNAISRGAMWLSTNKKILSSEGLPWPTEVKRSIPLYMSGVGDQTLIVRVDPRGMRARYVHAWLKDNVLRRQVEINMNAPTDYDFIGTGSAAWDSTRFEIVYVEAGRPSTGVTLKPDDAAEKPSVKLYPNPSKSSDVKLSLRAMSPGAYTVHILDMTGRLVATTSLQHRSVNGEYRILEGRLLSPGKYLIRLSQSGTPVQTLQLIHE